MIFNNKFKSFRIKGLNNLAHKINYYISKKFKKRTKRQILNFNYIYLILLIWEHAMAFYRFSASGLKLTDLESVQWILTICNNLIRF